MAFTTITAKYSTKCKRCDRVIPAGSRIRYGGRNRAYHLAAECPATTTTTTATTDGKTRAANDTREA